MMYQRARTILPNKSLILLICIGLIDLVTSEGRASGYLALHVLEVMTALLDSAAEGRRIALTTTMLHARGLIVELNPIMRPVIEHSEWAFALVKGVTLLIAFITMSQYARQNSVFVGKASKIGILMYTGIWIVWFTAAS